MRIGVIGGGSFGTALAKLLGELDHRVTLWFRNPELARAVATHRENRAYLPGYPLPSTVAVTDSIRDAVADQEVLVAVPPSHAMRAVMAQAQPHITGTPYIVSASKGIEEGSRGSRQRPRRRCESAQDRCRFGEEECRSRVEA
jgi:glycerol-3-phosphate dehydrogenase (NAD(P)+)